MATDLEEAQEEALSRAVARLRSGVLALVFGMTCGVGLWVATAWLVIRGGHNIGAHLGLLRFYFPGYSVTWPGAFLGLVYGFLAGGLTGYVLASIYNRLADWRAP
jgi:hypothetical protein